MRPGELPKVQLFQSVYFRVGLMYEIVEIQFERETGLQWLRVFEKKMSLKISIL